MLADLLVPDFIPNDRAHQGYRPDFDLSATPYAIVQAYEALDNRLRQQFEDESLVLKDPWGSPCYRMDFTQETCVKIDDEDGVTEQEEFFLFDGNEITQVSTDAVVVSDISLPSKLDNIRAQFGLGTSHLANVLDVERPTIYAWQKGESKPHDKRRERIETVYALAQFWQGMDSHSLGNSVFEPVKDGKSVLDLLCQPDLDADLIKKVLIQWRDSQQATRSRLKDKAIALKGEMDKRGYTPLPSSVVDQTFREITRTRS